MVKISESRGWSELRKDGGLMYIKKLNQENPAFLFQYFGRETLMFILNQNSSFQIK